MPKHMIFGSFYSSQRPHFSLSDGVWNPPTDIYETPDATVIRIEIGGIDEERLKITNSGNKLVVQGKRERPLEDRSIVYQMMEVHYGIFERHFAFNYALDKLEIKANYEKGFLIVRVPKSPPPGKGRNIEIKIIADSSTEEEHEGGGILKDKKTKKAGAQ